MRKNKKVVLGQTVIYQGRPYRVAEVIGDLILLKNNLGGLIRTTINQIVIGGR